MVGHLGAYGRGVLIRRGGVAVGRAVILGRIDEVADAGEVLRVVARRVRVRRLNVDGIHGWLAVRIRSSGGRSGRGRVSRGSSGGSSGKGGSGSWGLLIRGWQRRRCRGQSRARRRSWRGGRGCGGGNGSGCGRRDGARRDGDGAWTWAWGWRWT